MTPTVLLTREIVDLLDEFDCPKEDAQTVLDAALKEYRALLENRAEQAWEEYHREPLDDTSYRNAVRQAGRGHLLKD